MIHFHRWYLSKMAHWILKLVVKTYITVVYEGVHCPKIFIKLSSANLKSVGRSFFFYFPTVMRTLLLPTLIRREVKPAVMHGLGLAVIGCRGVLNIQAHLIGPIVHVAQTLA